MDKLYISKISRSGRQSIN